MKGRMIIKRIIVSIFTFTMVVIPRTSVNATESTNEAAGQHELILVLDASSSMKENDPANIAPDALTQLTETLPKNWNVGLVTYNGNVTSAADISNEYQQLHSILNSVEYTGHTNTGAAINQALTMFTDSAAGKDIVLLTDGEISMPDEAQTQEANALMDTALQNAGNLGVTIHTIGLGDGFQSYENSVKRCSEQTGGTLIEATTAEELLRYINQLAVDTLQIKQISIGAAKMSGSSGTYTAKLPFTGVAQAKVLIISESPVSDVTVSCEGSEIKTITTGKRYAAATINEPKSDISVTYTSNGKSDAWMILSHDSLQLLTQVSYTDNELPAPSTASDGNAQAAGRIDRTAGIKIGLADKDGNVILDNQSFESMSFPVQINGEAMELSPEDGYLNHDMPVSLSGTIPISVDLSSLPLNIADNVLQADVSIEAPPPISPEPTTISLIVLIGTLAALALVILALFLFFRKKDKAEAAPAKAATPIFNSKFEFTGKLNIYITKTIDDIDVPPLTFDLFRLNKKREISVKDMLNKCEMPQEFPGTEKIMFIAGRKGSLQIVNDSDCTILIGRDILVKTRSHQLDYGEKIHITCDDDAEMELHYRSVKPSEMRMSSDAQISYVDL